MNETVVNEVNKRRTMMNAMKKKRIIRRLLRCNQFVMVGKINGS